MIETATKTSRVVLSSIELEDHQHHPFADRGCRVVSTTNLNGCILGFLDHSRYYVFQAAPQLYSRG
jgi:hypothetical protein